MESIASETFAQMGKVSFDRTKSAAFAYPG